MRYLSTNFRKSRHRRPPQLLHDINNRAWERAELRCSTHPQEMFHEDAWGNTPLHSACRLNPPREIVKLLLPIALSRNVDGATALHVACCHKSSPEVISLLLEALNKGNKKVFYTRTGKTPLHYACSSFRSLCPSSFRALLNCMPHDLLFYKDHTGQTPLSLLLNRFQQRIDLLQRNEPDHFSYLLQEFWTKANLFLQSYTRTPPSEFCMVHSCLRIPPHLLPPPIITIALLLEPHQLALGDRNGDLPLHIAARYPHTPSTLLCSLLRLYPPAVQIPNHRGQLPLNVAMPHQSSENIRIMIQAFPQALHTCISDDRCWPFVLEWLGGAKSEVFRENVQIMYEVVRSEPSIVRGAVVDVGA